MVNDGKMSMKEYAHHRGISIVAVHKAVGKKIHPSEYFEGKRKHLRFDPIVCDADWIRNGVVKKNTDPPPPSVIPITKSGRPTREQSEARAYLNATLPKRDSTNDPRGVENGFGEFREPRQQRKVPQERSDEQKETIELARRRARADTERSEADSLKARLSAEQAAQLLVDAEDMEDAFSSLAADVRDRMLNIAPSLKALYPDMATEVIEAVGIL
jgi:ribosomal protein L9